MRWWLALAVVSLGLVLAALFAVAISPAPFLDDAVFALSGVAALVVGALLVAHRPGNGVGRLLVVIGAGWSIGEAARLYLWLHLEAGPLPFTDLAAWLVSWIFAPAWMLIPFLLVVFPSGRVAPGALRWPLRVLVVLLVAFAATGMLVPSSLDSYGDYLKGFTNPWAIEALAPLADGPAGDVLEAVGIAAFAVLAVLAMADLLRRWRRARGVERLQMYWFALGVVLMVLLLATGGVLTVAGAGRVAENASLLLAINAPPIGIGVAVARYRLYEIDTVVNRTLVYGALTATLAAAYLGGVLLLQVALGPLTEESDLAVAGSTLAVAALFGPARARIQAGVDRRFYRRRYDAARTLERFGAHLRDEVDLGALSAELRTVVSDAMQPAHVSLWLRGPR